MLSVIDTVCFVWICMLVFCGPSINYPLHFVVLLEILWYCDILILLDFIIIECCFSSVITRITLFSCASYLICDIFQPKRSTALSRDPNVVTNSQEEADLARGIILLLNVLCMIFQAIIFLLVHLLILQLYNFRCKKAKRMLKAFHHIIRHPLKRVQVYILVLILCSEPQALRKAGKYVLCTILKLRRIMNWHF